MRLKRIIPIALAASLLLPQNVYAKFGDVGFFGGVSQGTRLPKTTELLLEETSSSRRTRGGTALPYKEVVFLSGVPQEFEGLLTVTTNGSVEEDEAFGTYRQTFSVRPGSTTNAEVVSITRTIEFNVNWRREGTQVIKDFSMRSWNETLTSSGVEMRIDPAMSQFNVSIIEDEAPGCTYYKGNISERAVYIAEEEDDDEGGTNSVRLEVAGSFYGYHNAWSSTEAQRLDGYVYTDDWQMQYQVRPSVVVAKRLNYSANEPTIISFAGNYQEIMQNLSGASYNIYMKPNQFYQAPDFGNVNVASYNTFEQLIAPDTSFLKGHPAEQDISRLFAMQVLDGDPKFYQPSQAITRGQFVTAVVKAVKLPIEPVVTTGRGRATVQHIVFPDVTQDRPNYPYIMAAYKAGLALGRSNGMFYSDQPIERQEALAILLRALGLQQLGLDPTPITPFADDASIASWAKRELYAAHRIGLIYPDDNGRINPKNAVSKAEAAAVINRLIDYMRADIAEDYSSHIVNYPN